MTLSPFGSSSCPLGCCSSHLEDLDVVLVIIMDYLVVE